MNRMLLVASNFIAIDYMIVKKYKILNKGNREQK